MPTDSESYSARGADHPDSFILTCAQWASGHTVGWPRGTAITRGHVLHSQGQMLARSGSENSVGRTVPLVSISNDSLAHHQVCYSAFLARVLSGSSPAPRCTRTKCFPLLNMQQTLMSSLEAHPPPPSPRGPSCFSRLPSPCSSSPALGA